MSAVADTVVRIPLGEFVRLSPIRPAGALVARRSRNGTVLLYWRHHQTRRRLDTVIQSPLDVFQVGTRLEEAVAEAEKLARAEANAVPARRERSLPAASRAPAARDGGPSRSPTVLAVLLTYGDALVRAGRPGGRDVLSSARRHVADAHPAIAELPARRFRLQHQQALLDTLVGAGKQRSATKLASYLRCAWKRAGLEPVRRDGSRLAATGRAPVRRPVRSSQPRAGVTSPDQEPGTPSRSLEPDLPDLRRYWQAIRQAEGRRGAVLRLHLLLGTPRLAPLLQLMSGNAGRQSVTLMDATGRAGAPPRPLTLPLSRSAALALAECDASGVYALSSNGGRSPLSTATVATWVAQASEGLSMRSPGALRTGFILWLARQGTDPALVARLLSRGVPGAQAHRLDGHGFLPEKRWVLEQWARWLDAPARVREPPDSAPAHRDGGP